MGARHDATQRRIVLSARPAGAPRPGDFRIELAAVPRPADREILVRNTWLSLDPYVRARMDAGESYAEGMALGDVIIGSTVGYVIESRHPDFSIGDRVEGPGGWQQYAVLAPRDPSLLTPGALPVRTLPGTLQRSSLALGALGMPGLTAWIGLHRYARPRSGECVVVSSAAGTVGSLAGQFARMLGARVVGIAGGTDKCRFVRESIGLDDCVDYRSSEFGSELRAACRDGIDVYFDNVGGKVAAACFGLLNENARVVVCGQIASYNADASTRTVPGDIASLLTGILVRRLSVIGFIVSDHWHEYPAFLAATMPLIQEGTLRVHEQVYEGLERAPEAFIGLLAGANVGKAVVRIAPEG